LWKKNTFEWGLPENVWVDRPQFGIKLKNEILYRGFPIKVSVENRMERTGNQNGIRHCSERMAI
jgi:hypothetical protein